MASYRNIKKNRPKKDSHFSYTSEGMISLTSPHPPHDPRLRDHDNSRQDARSVLSVRPDQEPVLRRPPGHRDMDSGQDVDKSSAASRSSQSSEVNLHPESLNKLHEIIEAQKAFLKYQEIREILSRQETSRAAASIKSRKSKRAVSANDVASDISKSVSLNLQSDSDKENSKSKSSQNVRKVARVVDDAEKAKKRKSESPISDVVREENVCKEKKSVMTSPVGAQTATVQTEHGESAGVTEGGATCDWAYWYVPDTGRVRPAKVTIRSSRQGQSEGAETQDRARSQSRDVKPWRAGMKKQSSAAVVADEQNIVEKPLPEKPWRSNMRKEPKSVEPEKVPKPTPEERAWRHNMKKETSKEEPKLPIAKKRHYDRKEVREFIKQKKVKERELKEEKDKEENLRKEMIARRLTELDKLQKQISESDLKEFRKMGQAEKHLTEEGQRVLREKLMELTEQMKDRWKERQTVSESIHQTDKKSSTEEVSPQILITSRREDKQADSKAAVSQEQQSSLLHVEDAGVVSLSEVSDATEMKSLSENPRNISNRSNDSSMTWREKLLENDDTKYKSLDPDQLLNKNPTPLTDEVPERDVTESKSEKLRKIVSEVFERHRSDLEYIRNNVEDVDVPDSSLPADKFVPRFPTILTSSPPPPALTPASLPDLEARPRPVPTSRLSSGRSEDTVSSEQPPQWIEVTRDNIEVTRDITDPEPEAGGRNKTTNLSATVYKALPSHREADLSSTSYQAPAGLGPEPPIAASSPELAAAPGTFINTVLRKYELPAPPNNTTIPSDMAVSEGPLSPSDISEVSSYAGVFNPKTYSKDEPDIIGVSKKEDSKIVSQKTDIEELTDSESTLKGIDDIIQQNSPRNQEDLERIKKAIERRKRKKDKSNRNNLAASGSTVPDALHLRFLTELHQLETVNNTQRLLDELETIKKSAFDNHKGLEEVQEEMSKQRKLIEDQNNADKYKAAQRELQEMYSSKLQKLLESQNEVTKVTSDVARHLSEIAGGQHAGAEAAAGVSVVHELQTLIETLQQRQRPASSRQGASITTQTSTQSSSREKSKTSTPSKSRSKSSVTSRSGGRAESGSGRDETDGVIQSEIPSDFRTISSKPPSSILELIEQNQASGSSIQKTISEALASISESERKTKSSDITEQVEEELSTDYSSHFEDESTLKEKSFQALLPSVSHKRKSLKGELRKKTLQREVSTDASESSDKDQKDLSSHSLFSDTHSFSRFTLEMVNQYMEEENVRDQHKKALLKAKEKALIEKAKRKVDELDRVSEEFTSKGQDDKMPDIKKKKKAILAKLKERRVEISQMRENLKVAEKERSFLIQEQKSLLTSRETMRQSQQPHELVAADNISQVEVLKGLKKLDKSKRCLTNKQRKLAERKPMNVSRPDNVDTTVSSAIEVDTETDATKASDVDADPKTGRSAATEDDSIQTQISRSRVSTVRTVTRTRHSSGAESENEWVRDCQDTLSTVSDHSDVEARIAALSVKLQNRMRTAAKLKKEQKRERKEMLRNQEVTLKKQIEKYEQLISEGFAEIASEKSDESFSKPKIKSPISGKTERKAASSPRTPIITPELPSLSSLSFVEEDVKVDSEHVETPSGSNSTILASPKKIVSPISLHEISKGSDNISEAIEDASQSSTVSSKSGSPVSKLKLLAEGKAAEVISPHQSPEKSRISISDSHQPKPSDYSSQFEVKSTVKDDKKEVRKQELPVEKFSEKLVDSITNSLWSDILQETKTQLSPQPAAAQQKKGKVVSKLKSQEFTLAFDVNSSSEESITPIKQPESDIDTDDTRDTVENEFMDDDFGLSNIRQEAEILRLQQLRVEEEIAALQRESLQLGPVPDKPPPPYQPPEVAPATPASVPPPRPEKPPQVKVVVPNKKEEVLQIVEKFVTVIYEAKERGLELSNLFFDPNLVELPDDYTEAEKESSLKYYNMLFSVTLEKVIDIYKWETAEQNPPWMQQLPLDRMRFLTPTSLPSLVSRVQAEVCSDLKMTRRVQRENLLVRWAGKKRDRVDEILVRELQEEEVTWVNYGEDEVLVKDQMADTILESLIADTVNIFSEILRKKS